jgi:threonine/homoserine/homoserine lactone efflux protein
MTRALLTLVLLLAAPAAAWACPICFRVEENGVTHGVQAAVLVLMGVTTGVLSGFGVFIARIVRRSRSPR